MPQVIMVTSRRHACPNCGHTYWTNTYTTLRLGSPFRKCEQCGQEFIDKDLYREWACMTRGQRRRYMHYRLNQGLEMMRISSYVLFPIGLYLTIIGPLAWGSAGVSAAITGGVLMAVGVILFFLGGRYFKSVRKFMSDPEVAESVERTKEPDYRAKMIGMGYQFYK